MLRKSITTLVLLILFSLVLGLFGTARAQGGYDPTVQTSTLLYDEARTVYLGNLARHDNGVPPLRWNRQLTHAVRWFSWDSVENRPGGYCGHDDTQGNAPWDRAAIWGYLGFAGAENAFCDYVTPVDAIAGWMNSPGHRANLLDATWREVGLGYYRRLSDGRGYIAQVFGVDSVYAPVIIENEAVSTTSTNVNLYLYDRPTSGGFTSLSAAVTQMMVSNSPNFQGAAWEPYNANKAWALTGGIGWRNVYVKTRDRFNRSQTVSDTIYLGANVPLNELGSSQMSTRQSQVTLYNLNGGALPQVQFSPGWLADDAHESFTKWWGNGERVNDAAAWGGTAFRFRPGAGETFAWVNEWKFPIANVPLVAYVRLKVNNNTSSAEVARISVDGGSTEYGPLSLQGTDFAASNQYQEFALNFTFTPIPEDEFLTFQFWGSGSADVYVDAVSIFSAPQAITSPLTWSVPGNNYRGQGVWVRYTNGSQFSPISEGITIQPPTYTISGNAGLAGVTLSYTDATLKTAIADGSGNYSFTVPLGWSGTVTPSKTGYTFSPVSRSYTNVTTNKTAQNYTAVLIRYTISGNVGASGITLNYTDGVAKTAISQANGNYSFTVPYNWSGTVTPAPTCYTFTPTSKTYVNVLANQAAQNYTAAFNGASGCSNISIDIGGVNQGDYGVAPQTSTRDSYPINNGPVKATSPNAVPFLIAERDAWMLNGVVQSFSEMMGLPGNQVTDTYYFPWYNNVTMDTQLRFANLGNTSTNITVTIAGVTQPVIPLAAGVSTRVSYAGINAGPVKVESSGSVPIIVAERDAWLLNGVVQSFSEMMGLPGSQVMDTYYFPWYNNVTMDTQLRFANLGVVPTDITVTIAGVAQAPITVAAGESTRVSYPINAGPVKVQSTGGVPILVAERDAWLINGVFKSFSEMMGLPGNQLTTTYYFPWYNNVTMDTQLRFANLGVAATNITVTIAGVAQPVIPLAAGVSTRVSYAGINNGPVTVTSSGGVPIIVAERDAWLLNGAVRSFSEMMGLPGNQLTTTYYFPWYNNLAMDTQLRFAVP